VKPDCFIPRRTGAHKSPRWSAERRTSRVMGREAPAGACGPPSLARRRVPLHPSACRRSASLFSEEGNMQTSEGLMPREKDTACLRVPGALQHVVMQCRPGTPVSSRGPRNRGPGSAVHRYACAPRCTASGTRDLLHCETLPHAAIARRRRAWTRSWIMRATCLPIPPCPSALSVMRIIDPICYG